MCIYWMWPTNVNQTGSRLKPAKPLCSNSEQTVCKPLHCSRKNSWCGAEWEPDGIQVKKDGWRTTGKSWQGGKSWKRKVNSPLWPQMKHAVPCRSWAGPYVTGHSTGEIPDTFSSPHFHITPKLRTHTDTELLHKAALQNAGEILFVAQWEALPPCSLTPWRKRGLLCSVRV